MRSRQLVPECDEWWGRCAGYPGRDDRGAFKAYVRSIQAQPGLFQSAMPDATVREVREALELREQVIDFAVEAQGLDAVTLQERVPLDASRCSRRPPNLPRRERKPARIDLADIQGNVLRGYTWPAAAYLFLRIVDVERARRLMTRMIPQVVTAESWRRRAAGGGDERRVHRLGAGAAGLAGGPRVLPARVPRGDGGAGRAPRGSRAVRARGVGARARYGRGARARHRLRRRQAHPARRARRA